MSVYHYKPGATITMYTETGELVARYVEGDYSGVDNDIVSIQTTREMGADAPTFSISLTRRKHWHKYVSPNDLIVIKMCRPPRKERTVFVGLVEDVRKKVVMQGDAPQRVITICGRGVAKAFFFDIGVVPETQYNDASVGWLLSNGVTIAGSTPDSVMQVVWNDIAKKYVNFKWSSGKQLFDIISLKTSARPDTQIIDDSNLLNYQGTLWSFLKEIAEEPFYELFWEIGDSELPELLMRPTPFNQTEWSSLASINISDEEVVIEDIGRSDLETYTLYSVGAKLLMSTDSSMNTLGLPPLYYEPYYDKYGIRRLHKDTIYLAMADSTAQDPASDVMQSLMTDLFNWNIRNNSMFNGTFVLKGDTKYQVGRRLTYTSVEDNSTMEYYITSVSHNFHMYNSWTTEVGVTRGLVPSDRFSAPFGSGKEFDKWGTAMTGSEGGYGYIGSGDYPLNTAPPTGDNLTKAQAIVQGAYKVMNEGVNGRKIKYVFGGKGVQYGQADCSQFTQYVFNTYGSTQIGRNTGSQVGKGTKVNKADACPGDLIFFKNTYNSSHIYGVSHVGIVVGNNMMIHNSSGSGGVVLDSYDTKYWNEHFLMIRRIFADSPVETPKPGNATGQSKVFEATAYGAHKINIGMPDPDGKLPDYPYGYKTAIGTTVRKGVVAVDKTVIPMRTKLYIESDYPGITGEYIAEDVGGAIKGNKIDIYFEDTPPHDPYKARQKMLDFGRRNVKVTILS